MSEPRAKILVVDDEPTNLELLVRVLRRKFDVVTAPSGKEALEILRRDRFAVILSDQRMPGMTGTQFLAEAQRLVPETVRMILTGYTADTESIEAINMAHVAAFLTKPVAPELVERTITDGVAVYNLGVKNQDLLQQLEQKNDALAEAKQLIEASLDERTRQLLAANERLESLALRDVLTGVYNHRYFHERLGEELERQRRHGGSLSLVLCDLDQFAAFNEARGHKEGDNLLVWLSQILTGPSRGTDLVARYGGEEFALIVPETAKDGTLVLCERIRQAMKKHPYPGGELTVSFGIAEAPGDATSKQKLVEAAEIALRRAKTHGRDRIELY